ncbi:hypothetical protein LPJ73_001273 [Coemansia sp. RSA 2703]|nr:hypothetical protein LPJ73_001273 [Coemansia sp. RSA 2703]
MLPPDNARPRKRTSKARKRFRRSRSDANRYENQTTTSANVAISEPVAEQQAEIAEQLLYQQAMQSLEHGLLQNLAHQPAYNSVDAFLQPMTWLPTQVPVDGLLPLGLQHPMQDPVYGLLPPLSEQPTQNSVDGLQPPVSQQPTYDSAEKFLQNMAWQSTRNSVDELLQDLEQQPMQGSAQGSLPPLLQQPTQDPVSELLQDLPWQPTHDLVQELQPPLLQQPTYDLNNGLLQDLAQQPVYSLVDMLQPLLQQPIHDLVNELLQNLAQQPTQGPVHGLLPLLSQQPTYDSVNWLLQDMAWQPTQIQQVEVAEQQPVQLPTHGPMQDLPQQLTQESSQQPTQESSQQPTRESSQELTRESSQELTRESSQELTRESSQQPTQESSQQPTRESSQEVVKNSSGDSGNHGVNTKRPNPEQDPPSNVDEADTKDLSDEEKLLSSDSQYGLTQFATERFRPLTYKPRQAIVHCFGNMDSETVVVYGDDKLQLWNPVSKSLVGEWDGGPQNVHIGQVEPVSPSTLAIVSTGASENERLSKAGRLHFADLNWSTENNRFSDMTVRQWVGDELPVEDISVVENVHQENIDDESELSLFTGSMTDGAVYRGNFDISDGKVRMANQQKMVTSHNDSISALCHIAAKNCLISGTTSGSICVNDHKTGSCIQSFSLAEGGSVSSFTHCPFNPNMFLVGSCHPANKLMIFDIRENMRNGPKLVLQDAGSTITAQFNKPAWDTETGLVLAPVRRIAMGTTIATVNIWEPRFVRCKDAVHLELHSDEKEVYSVDFTTSADVKKRVMVTAITV